MNSPLTKRMMTGLGVGALALATMPKAAAAPFSTFAYAATGAPTSRTTANRLADVINVKDYGAKGNGIANDGAAIQAAFDAAYGPASSPHGATFTINKGVFFPAGKYLVDQQLFLNNVQGAWIFGAGQNATQLVYTGTNSKLPSGDLTSLLTCRTLTYSHIQGITFDVTASNAAACVQLMNFAALANDGTGNSWVDCGFIGGSIDGFLCTLDGSQQLGSEQLFANCSFANCQRGVAINSGNALNYTIVGCQFSNCVQAIWCVVGSVNTIMGCSFNNPSYATFQGTVSGTNLTVVSGLSGTIEIGQLVQGAGIDTNGTYITGGSGSNWTLSRPATITTPETITSSALDIWIFQNQAPVIIGCRSVSPNFCMAGPAWIAGCIHNPPVAGGFLNGFAGFATGSTVIEGCSGGANSGIYGRASQTIYLRGNSFANAGYLSNFAGTVSENI